MTLTSIKSPEETRKVSVVSHFPALNFHKIHSKCVPSPKTHRGTSESSIFDISIGEICLLCSSMNWDSCCFCFSNWCTHNRIRPVVNTSLECDNNEAAYIYTIPSTLETSSTMVLGYHASMRQEHWELSLSCSYHTNTSSCVVLKLIRTPFSLFGTGNLRFVVRRLAYIQVLTLCIGTMWSQRKRNLNIVITKPCTQLWLPSQL